MATKLKLERIKRDWSQQDLVTLTFFKIDQPRLSKLERGARPKPEEVAVLGRVFGMAPRDLWPNLEGVEGLEAGNEGVA